MFVIDVAKCSGCHSCQIACKDEHVGNDWTPITKPQPDTGQFWVKLTERVKGTVPKVKVAYPPHRCMHWDQAPCAVDVKDGKIVRVRPLHYDWKYDFKDVNPWKFEQLLERECVGG